jgi:hypothetical protein
MITNRGHRARSSADSYRLSPVPTRLRRSRPDNLALVPGSLLLQRPTWQRIANRLPANAILIVLPSSQPEQRKALLASAALLAAKGHQIRVVSADKILPLGS